MTPAQPRTFGDLIGSRFKHLSYRCSFCKREAHDGKEPQYGGARSYSTRHYVCDPCIDARHDVVLPSVLKQERFDAKLKALR